MVTWPSASRTTLPSLRTHKTVVPCMAASLCEEFWRIGIPPLYAGVGQRAKGPEVKRLFGRLPEFDAVALWIGEPAETAVVVSVAFRIDDNPRGGELVQHGIEVVHLEIQHGGLGGWEIIGRPREESDSDRGSLRFAFERKAADRTWNAKVLFVPSIESFRIIGAQKGTAEPSDLGHVFPPR